MRPLLVGMNNPISDDPRHALFPHPEGCSGHFLWLMLRERVPHASRDDYVRTFDRVNLVVGDWTRETGKRAADLLYAREWGSGRTVVLLGEEVRKAFGHPRLLVHPQTIGGCIWRQIPHPSGRNLWYNDREHRRMVGTLLEELYATAKTKGE